MFASVRRHFDDPRVRDAVLVNVSADTEGAEPVRLTAAETHEALYGPDSDPQFAAAVWKGVLRTALNDLAPHGTGKLLLIWLALPRLTRTVHRVCTRLGADRSDVEAEMTLALLEGLVAAPDATSRLSESSLIQAACTRAWQFARNRLRELPSAQVGHIAQDRALTASGGETDTPDEEGLDVRVDRPDGPDGLRAPLRFRVRPEHLRKGVYADTYDGTRDRSTRHNPRTNQRPECHVETRPVRPAGRRA
ncbi:hypothetical protein IQ63_22110 [Streptomyces acidiscabies]|uniref:Uncharacterized protein n=2 Tax=Streptomyces acidiscabies TaxID=42234 RepID=A0A0L0K578_9ACTN|nr:hypothetical protein IQ63_22110 [Streptomyces acidiscabies]